MLAELNPGDIINERYRLNELIGRGGMGVVYRGHDILLQREIALKLMANTSMGDDVRQRMLREAQLAAQLTHPNIVAVHDAGQVSGTPYIVMELVEGHTLRQFRGESLNQVIVIAEQICLALSHAHQHGVVHRDLKPENIIIGSNGIVKLMDFGLAHLHTSNLTATGVMLGTVNYMAPEQIRGDKLDPRTDLYALGVMLYEMLTGSVPFEADTALAVITQHLYAPPVPACARNAQIPAVLDGLISQLLSKEPAERPNSAEEVRAALLASISVPAEEQPADVPALERITRGRLIGRREEVQQVRAHLRQAMAGKGGLVLISGEPGIGKSRLAQEVMAEADASGGHVLRALCFEEGGGPYDVFAQLLRTVLLEDIALPELPDFVLSDLLTIAPDLQSAFPDHLPQPVGDSQFQQQRLLQSVNTFFQRLAEKRLLVVVIEDLHWADASTLIQIGHLARHLAHWPLLLLATYREVELTHNPAFQRLLAGLNRERVGTRIKIARLGLDETRTLLASMFAEEITDDFLEGIYKETEGNPFFVEEICKALLESGRLYYQEGQWHRPSIQELRIPQGIRVAIEERVGKLPHECREVLNMAAIFGQRFYYDALQLASNMDDELVLLALEQAEDAQLIQGSSDNYGVSFTFVHALIPSSLAENLNILRRQRMHARAAEALLQVRPDDFETLAHHFSAAGNLDKAIEYYRMAAARSRSVYAYDLALEQIQTVVDLVKMDSQSTIRADIYEELADVQTIYGQADLAIENYRHALDLLASAKDPDRLTVIRLHRKLIDSMTRVLWFDDWARVQHLVDRSLREAPLLVEEVPPHAEVVYLYQAISSTIGRDPILTRAQSVEEYAQKALEIAEQLGEPRVKSAALGAMVVMQLLLGNPQLSHSYSEERLALIEEHLPEDIVERIDVLRLLTQSLMQMGEFPRALELSREAYQLAGRVHHINLMLFSLVRQSVCEFSMDHWDNVLSLENDIVSLEQEYESVLEGQRASCFHIGLMAAIHVFRGEAERASELTERSREIMMSINGSEEHWDRSSRY